MRSEEPGEGKRGDSNAVKNGLNTLRKSIVALVIFSLVAAATTGHLLGGNAQAQSVSLQKLADNEAFVDVDGGGRRLAPDLEESIQIAQNQGASYELQRVIIQLSDSAADMSDSMARGAMTGKLMIAGGRYRKSFKSLGLVSAELPLSRIRELQDDPDIAYISPDRPVTSLAGHVYITTGAQDGSTDIPSLTCVNGTGVGIAILDSGIDTSHELTKTTADHPGVIYSKDFTGQATTQDRYGHGTHVASLAAGRNDVAGGAYTGIAAQANLLNLRVLNDLGAGSASNAIAAIDWCISYKNTYNIRVINMSLGAKARDSYRTDPLCLAVRRAHDAGIVVVCAAGNDGKDVLGRKIYGGVHSPGIDPSVITVGATNSFGTDSRSDDTVATYSSHGPTRGYTTSSSGVKRYDNLIKPDLVAPGNKLLGACSPVSQTKLTSLFRLNPLLNPGTASSATKQMMFLSGTSMSAALVSGAAAMVLEANPTMTPNLVKAVLMYSAQPITGVNNFEQGAGRLNVEGAVRLAGAISQSAAALSNGAPMLTGAMPAQNDWIAGSTCYWGKGVITNYCFVYGNSLMTYWQGAYAQSVLLSDATTVANGSISRSSTMTSGGVMLSEGVLLGDGILLSDGVLLADGVLLGDGILLVDGVLLGDGILLSDSNLFADALSSGDNTVRMQFVLIP